MGEVLAISSTLKDFIITLDIAEATIALRAIIFTQELGFYKVVLESNDLTSGVILMVWPIVSRRKP